MDNNSLSCPDSRELREFFSGHLQSNRSTEIAHHLAQCDQCAIQAGKLDVVDSPFVETFKRVSAQPRPFSFDICDSFLSTAQIQALHGNPIAAAPGRQPTLNSAESLTEDGDAIQSVQPPQIIGRYSIRRLIGRGGMGSVYEAFDEKLQRAVAIKFPHQAIQNDEIARQRFQLEGRTAAGIHHPNVCGVLDSDEADGLCYLTMPLLKGLSLAQRLKSSPPLELSAVIEIVIDVCRGLNAVHATGAVHRDIKPSNVFLQENSIATLMDFGIARSTHTTEKITHSGCILGTPTYFAPEQAKGDTGSIGPSTDIYAVGVLLYEVLSGSPPFGGTSGEIIGHIQHSPIPTLRSSYQECDNRLTAICMKALSKDPKDRFPSAQQFALVLEDWLNSRPHTLTKHRVGDRVRIYRAVLISAMVLGVTMLVVCVSLLALNGGLGTHAEIVSTGVSHSRQMVESSISPAESATVPQQELESYLAEHSIEPFVSSDRLLTSTVSDTVLGTVIRTSMSLDGKSIAVLHEGPPAVTIWDAESGQRISQFKLPKLDTVISLEPDSRRLATAGGGWHVRIWDCSTAKEIFAFAGHKNWINTVKFDRTGEFGASISKDRSLRMFDLESQSSRWNADIGVWPRALAISFSGQQIAVGCNDGTIKLWNAKSGTKEGSFVGSHAAVVELHFSAKEQQLLSVDADGELAVRDLVPGQDVWRAKVRPDSPVVADRNCELVGVTSVEGDLQIRRFNDGSLIWEAKKQHSDLNWKAVGFSEDGKVFYMVALNSILCRTQLPP